MKINKKNLINTFIPNTKVNLVRGFTIVEILVAITVFTIGVLGVSGFFATSTNVTRSANNTTTASNLAEGMLDNQLAKSYDELPAGNGVKTDFSNVSSDPYHNYSYQINISLIDQNLAASSDVGLKKIDVFVYWMEGTKEKNVEMSTIKARQS